ncbi:MAG: hypothetical protein F6J86_33105 [Symploca sp. SIO1B1]|nr:hypothetical protein [Symploca sp. SIO1B1]
MLSDSYNMERLRQAKSSFNLAFALIASISIINLATVLLFLSGNVSTASVTTAGGIYGAINVCCLKFCKDANDRLDETAKVSGDEA